MCHVPKWKQYCRWDCIRVHYIYISPPFILPIWDEGKYFDLCTFKIWVFKVDFVHRHSKLLSLNNIVFGLCCVIHRSMMCLHILTFNSIRCTSATRCCKISICKGSIFCMHCYSIISSVCTELLWQSFVVSDFNNKCSEAFQLAFILSLIDVTLSNLFLNNCQE